MINLPAAFTERMKQMLGREYDAFIASYDKERSQGLRVNGLKTDPAEFAKTAPFSLNPVAWAAEDSLMGRRIVRGVIRTTMRAFTIFRSRAR